MKEAFRRLWTIQVFLALFLAANPVAADGTTAVALGSPVTGTISAPDEVDWYSVTTDVVGDLTVTQTAWPPYIDTRIVIHPRSVKDGFCSVIGVHSPSEKA